LRKIFGMIIAVICSNEYKESKENSGECSLFRYKINDFTLFRVFHLKSENIDYMRFFS
jgi:hypothetical protein